MALVAKHDSPVEQAMQDLEELMVSRGIRLECIGRGILVRHSNQEYWIKSNQSGEYSTCLPRFTDDERLVVRE